MKTWRAAAVIVTLTAAFVFLAERFVGRFFDTIFEVFIFGIPAVASIMLYLYFRRKLSASPSGS